MVEILPFIGKFYNGRLEKGLVHTAMCTGLTLCLWLIISIIFVSKAQYSGEESQKKQKK